MIRSLPVISIHQDWRRVCANRTIRFMRRSACTLLVSLLLVTNVRAQVAQVRHAPTLNGKVEGSLQVMLTENVTLNGGASVSGDLLLPGTPTVQLNGHPTYGGAVDGPGAASPTTHRVTLNGNARLGRLVRRTDALALTAVAAPPSPTGTRHVSLNNASDTPGSFATLKNLTLNGNVGAIAVPPGTYGDFTANGTNRFTLGVAGATTPAVYHFQRLTLNGSARLDVAGPVVVTLAHAISANGSLGDAAHPEWLDLRLASGGLTLNGSVTAHAYVIAPAGSVTINGNAQLIGGLVADRLTVNGNGLLRLLAPPVTDELPFLANFEPAEGYQPGALAGQQGWTATGAATVDATPRYAGAQALALAPAARAGRLFANTDPSVTFVDLFALPAAAATPETGVFLETEAARVALTGNGATGRLHASTGAAAWQATPATPPLDATGRSAAWLRLTTREDYAAQKWDLYLDGRMVAADLAFAAAPSAFTALGLSGHATQTTAFDDLLIAFENPLFADADHDGMDDAWETAHGLNIALNDRNADRDSDGLTNILEFMLGTNPTAIDTDGDGLPDKWEYQYGLDPHGNDASGDPDGDGVSNLVEFKQGRNPAKGAVADAAGAVNLRVFQPGN